MLKKITIVGAIVCCSLVAIISVNAGVKSNMVLDYDKSIMQAVIDEKIEPKFHTSIYPETINRDVITVNNVAYRKNILNQPKNKKNKTFDINRTYKSYILNADFQDKSTKWAKSEWYNDKMGSTLTGDLYLENGYDNRED